MNLKEILDSIGERKSNVAKWESVMDYRTQAGRDNAIRAAREEITALEGQYWHKITDSAIFFLAKGGDEVRNHEFKLAAEQQGGVCVDADAAYKSIAERCRVHMGPSQNQLTTRAQLFIVAELQSIANRYNLSTPIPQFPPIHMSAFVGSDSELLEVVRQTAQSIRVPLNFLAARTAVLQEAVAQQIIDDPVAFVVYGIQATELEQKSFLTQGRPDVVVDLSTGRSAESLLAAATNEAKKLLAASA